MDEKVLLQAIENMAGTIKSDMSQMMDEKLEPINTRLDKMDSDISEIKQRVTKIEITQENIIIPDIKKLCEGHDALNQKVSALS